MSGRRVGLFGGRRDPQIRALVAALEARGARAIVIDFRGFPRLNRLTGGGGRGWALDDLTCDQPIQLADLDVALVRADAYLHRSPREPARAAEHTRREIARLALQTAAITSLARRVPVVNPPAAHRYHRQKGLQHVLLRRAGVPTPDALVTNDPRAARRFVQARGGRAVAKPQAGGAEVVRADAAYVDAHAERIRARPFLFQQLVSGRSYRAYLLGGETICFAELLHDRARVDWRQRLHGAVPRPAPPGLEVDLRRAARLLDLPFCAVDLEHDDRTGRAYVLDLNPGAWFTHAARLLGVDLPGLIADYLLEIADRGEVWRGGAVGDG